MPFYKTRMGEEFICKTVPDLIRAIEKLSEVLERLVVERGSEEER